MAIFLDEAKINIKAGNGGNGMATFFHLRTGNKKVANGGNGGRGGDVIIKANGNINTLYGFKKKIHFKAENGVSGSANTRRGRDGHDLIIDVPVGTIIRDHEHNMIADLSGEGDAVMAAKGGIGGRGNASFKSQARRFPAFAEKGEVTEESWIDMELRVLADVALVGFPNAGKSTIISKISAAKPKIADYPFTTLTPHLGVVPIGDEDFVVADIPGLIEGAHDGTGLGDRFLRHITRSAVLAIILDGQKLLEPGGAGELIKTYDILRKEIRLYNTEVYNKDFVIIINKVDLISDRRIIEKIAEKLGKEGREVFIVSAATGEGLDGLISGLYKKVKENRQNTVEAGPDYLESKKTKVYTIPGDTLEDRKIEIIKSHEGYIVKNRKLERMVAMTDLENREALDYLKYRLKKMKVGDRLKKMGIDEGSTVIIGNLVFDLVN
ncbi:MAG: GTPase ObgE [Actinobacteria bacterium]|nr:GTPase ObgE [Actinomycetota bacterium]